MARATGARTGWALTCALLIVTSLGCRAPVDHFDADVDAAPISRPEVSAADGFVEDGAFYSVTLGREMPYLVWLPPGYALAKRRYPVLYYLHGIGASNREWLGYGVDVTADCLLAAGAVQPMLIVLPQGDEGYWLNHAGGPRWGDYVANDVVDYIDATYRTLPTAASRAVGGLSMGGHGALQLAFNHPDVFGVAGAHSPTLRPRAEAPEYFADAATFRTVDPLSLVRRGRGAAEVKAWLDAGEADPWLWRIEEVHEALQERGIAHEWHVWEGTHESEYWAAHVTDYLAYYSLALKGDGAIERWAPNPGADPAACRELGLLELRRATEAEAAEP